MRSQIEVAQELAQAHRAQDPKTSVVKFFPNGNRIQLLEVSEVAPVLGEILPYSFAAAPEHGVEYPATIILTSPADWQSVQSGELLLPQGWDIPVSVDL